MIRDKFKINTIFAQLFSSFLLLIAPIIVIGILMFVWEKQTIKNEIENNAIANLSFLRRTMESEVDNIKELQYNLSNDLTLLRLINQYSYVPLYDYYPMVLNVQDRLIIMKNSNSYIADVKVFIPVMNKVISAVNGYVEMKPDEYDYALQQYQNSKYPVIIDQTGIYTSAVYPFYTIRDVRNLLYLCEVRLCEDTIRKLLSKSNQINESDTALYDYTSKQWIFSSPGSFISSDSVKLENIAKSESRNIKVSASVDGKNYFMISIYSSELNASFVQYIPIYRIFSVPDRYGYFLWFYALLSIVIFVAYSSIIYKLVKNPINKIIESFRILGSGDLSIKICYKAADEFNYLYDEFNKMVDYLNELIDSNYKQHICAQRAELKQLQSQINPHFLYNSYFMLHRMIKDDDTENARLLSLYLGTYFQYITSNAFDEITLSKEIRHAISYAQIQQMRFSDRLEIELGNLPKKYKNFMVPRMILQPILENSIEHGLKKTLKNGRLRFAFDEVEDGLFIIIEDNGRTLSDDIIFALQQKIDEMGGQTETTGLLNIHRRLKLKYGGESGISVSRSKLGGLKVLLFIDVKLEPGTL